MEKKPEIFTDQELRTIKEQAITKYRYNAPDPRRADLFVVECYVEAMMDVLSKKKIIDNKKLGSLKNAYSK